MSLEGTPGKQYEQLQFRIIVLKTTVGRVIPFTPAGPISGSQRAVRRTPMLLTYPEASSNMDALKTLGRHELREPAVFSANTGGERKI